MTTRITVNGKTTILPDVCSNVSVRNGKVYVDGKEVEAGPTTGAITRVQWEGPAANVESDGDVRCGDVQGDVRAGMGVTCRDVGGSVAAGMNVDCQNVSGSVSAGMSVTRR